MAGLSRLREAVLSFHWKVIFNLSPIPVETSTYSNNGLGKNLFLGTAEAQTRDIHISSYFANNVLNFRPLFLSGFTGVY